MDTHTHIHKHSHYGNGVLAMLVLSSWKVNIAENPIAVMGL